ncbi:TIGR03013 family XrtA/PEP-CTERM system glycosyltransferase [Pseudomarimonas salicorniae]|uniref:TIGR03013 family PEP-CTERM/XrtA system glycosyltransferase n=1 Tax=Pseudomarimonas salicorniae TaxID=2933270 RepID=A0ABT0GHH2_9GAMM|nr:TIGR03013 family XrtA/PEP-CTERM system glycosyltransferase [Lysobacter sp. CAU 1642]MCK7593996.1 TIGR03013 family PEP-CTERM/XrtA system glycosyltransferase [Lysobacter sp. CAU 1642]
MRSLSDALHPARRWMVVLGLAEFAVLFGAFHLAVWIRFWGDDALAAQAFGAVMPRALVFTSVQVLAMAALGMYVMYTREGVRGYMVRGLVAFAVGGLALVMLQYLIPGKTIGRGVMAMALALGWLAVIGLRWLALHVVRAELIKRRVLVLGTGRRAKQLDARMRRRAERRTFQVVGYIPMKGDTPEVEEAQWIENGRSLVDIVEDLDIDEIVTAPDEQRGALPLEALMQCRLRGVEITDMAQFFENESGRVNLTLVRPSWVVFAEGFDAGSTRAATKRGFDLIMASLLLLLASPLMLLTALAIVLESGPRAPILYRQQRVGLAGRTFNVLKFRSMRTDAEADGKARWASSDDDRVTRVGKVIRKLRIDEIPQVWNVLEGSMSFVGPRPERPEFVRELAEKIPYFSLREAVKPGITGWAQIRYAYGASVEDAREKLSYDLYYVKNHSLVFDLMILLQTCEVVIFGKGAR